ncbi:JAB domain-containing protein [Thiomicrorhabdus cannonii]|uniref:JAB domain-containing protein n=1 Tax=Thiomicrorhabdus cannonii TaxID=2748011 RepID=UPI0015BC3894|nr:JAB domain-containing protein [Thiomicrorhabdus cannonii]
MLPYPFKTAETNGAYRLDKPVTAAEILRMANYLAKQKLKKGASLSSPETCSSELKTLQQEREHEVFGVIFLDQQHRIIRVEEIFRGTINAAAVILFHNHPSGMPQPSESDRAITKTIMQTLQLIDVRVLDHLIVGTEGFTSFAKQGLL